jgi:hypothetical protein
MLTLFTIPKPFRGHINIIQRNALRAWKQLEGVQIILFGNDEGTDVVARELDIDHVPGISRNSHGTPLVSDVFAKAAACARFPLLGYVNADIILFDDFLRAAQRTSHHFKRFLLAGQRWDLDVPHPLVFNDDWVPQIRERNGREGKLHAHTGMDYFVFPRGLFSEIPPFAVGRPVWDNWLLFRARQIRAVVVDGTHAITAIHQNHDYHHHAEGKQGIWGGPEMASNLLLAGGRSHVFTLHNATHRITVNGAVERLPLNRATIINEVRAAEALHPRLAPWIGRVRRVKQVLSRLQGNRPST